jgi:superfamily II DNA or RNA helicase
MKWVWERHRGDSGLEEFKLRGIASRVLIVVPSGLVLQWHEELLSRFGEQFVIYTTEYMRTLKQSYGKETNVWMVHDKIIASIDSIKPLKIDDELSPRERQRREWHNAHVYGDLAKAGFDLVIIDEAHKLSKHGDGSEVGALQAG